MSAHAGRRVAQGLLTRFAGCSGTTVATTRGLASAGWTESVAQAQQLVGSPTSLSSFRSLLGEDIATISGYAKRLMGSRHPFLHTARNLLLGNGGNQQYRGLTVLLMSKAMAALGKPEVSAADPILPKQRALAEICELIHTATLIHECTVDLSSEHQEMRGPQDDFLFANKMSVLGGDFLLANACTALGRLHNVQVVYAISGAIAQITEGLFLRARLTDVTLPNPLLTWASSTHRLGGSLLGQGCRSAALLAGLPEHVQQVAGDFGFHLGVAYQINASSRMLQQSSNPDVQLVCSSAPVAFALAVGHDYSVDGTSTPGPAISDDQRHLVEELRFALSAPADDARKFDADRMADIRRLVRSLGGDQRAAAATHAHAQRAARGLHDLPASDARDSLRRLAAAAGATAAE